MADREISWDQMVAESREQAAARDQSRTIDVRNEPGTHEPQPESEVE